MQSHSRLPPGDCTSNARSFDRERRLGADAEQALGFRLDAVAMAAAQCVQRGPALAVTADVLALVLADRAMFRLAFAFGELGTAGDADEMGHGSSAGGSTTGK